MKVKDTENYTIDCFVKLKKILEILNLIMIIEEKTIRAGNIGIQVSTSLLAGIITLLEERLGTLKFILNKLGEVEKAMEIK